MKNKPTRILGLVPAKGTSQRLPRKNIKKLAGIPLFQHAYNALKDSGLCTRIVLSSDDPEITELGREIGMDVPFIRPLNLTRDPIGVEEVALHCLTELKAAGDEYDILVIVLPTSPLLIGEDIEQAYTIFQKNRAARLIGVAEMEHSPFQTMQLRNAELVVPLFPTYFGKKSQQLPRAYRPVGLHVLDVPTFRLTRKYTAHPLSFYRVPWPRGIDIDTASDFMIAEALMGVSSASGNQ